jgi:hypothetical protein
VWDTCYHVRSAGQGLGEQGLRWLVLASPKEMKR